MGRIRDQFDKEFKEARNRGDQEFIFSIDGKPYHTRTKEEEDALNAKRNQNLPGVGQLNKSNINPETELYNQASQKNQEEDPSLEQTSTSDETESKPTQKPPEVVVKEKEDASPYNYSKGRQKGRLTHDQMNMIMQAFEMVYNQPEEPEEEPEEEPVEPEEEVVEEEDKFDFQKLSEMDKTVYSILKSYGRDLNLDGEDAALLRAFLEGRADLRPEWLPEDVKPEEIKDDAQIDIDAANKKDEEEEKPKKKTKHQKRFEEDFDYATDHYQKLEDKLHKYVEDLESAYSQEDDEETEDIDESEELSISGDDFDELLNKDKKFQNRLEKLYEVIDQLNEAGHLQDLIDLKSIHKEYLPLEVMEYIRDTHPRIEIPEEWWDDE
ncbi:MAG: hypothetical protein Unbinned5336contig1001_26 [Prokaryotic dsDNA virus sp.]|mgnify:CR=1 FL=1|nr:MAG: hypothetical protein Unbinned5336contig1001_26 [Prokaryotic dsDNA virus sp.]|tara:strand:- start:32603 stop:33742 length:1140 start_codon:yes stop_codon:yes gene_type:complete